MQAAVATPAAGLVPVATGVRLIRRARLLVAATLGWHGAEAVIAMTTGIATGSISLIAFGADVALEATGGAIVLWRLTGRRTPSPAAERRAQRLLALSFGLLAAYIAFEAVGTLRSADPPEASALGVAFAIGAMVLMPALCAAKARVGRELGSSAIVSEGRQNLLCAYLSRALFLGLAAHAALGWWWADPLAALAIAGIALREGARVRSGVSCCIGLAGPSPCCSAGVDGSSCEDFPSSPEKIRV